MIFSLVHMLTILMEKAPDADCRLPLMPVIEG
jgi:hypothetical protein